MMMLSKLSPSVLRQTWSRTSAAAATATATATTTTTALSTRTTTTTTAAATTTATTCRRSFSSSYEDRQRALQYDIIPKSDHGLYREYSVIHTDRSLNLMSDPFQHVMRDLNALLKTTYNAEKAVIIPGYVCCCCCCCCVLCVLTVVCLCCCCCCWLSCFLTHTILFSTLMDCFD